MKKTLKKILSVFLSVLMFASVVPTFSLTASAAEKNVGLVAEYFTGSDITKDYTSNGHTLTVNNAEWWNNATDYYGNNFTDAYFGTNYSKVDNLLNGTGVTTSTGFAVEFEGYSYKDTDNRRYIDIGTNEDLVYDNGSAKDSSGKCDSAYVFVATSGRVGVKRTSFNGDAATNHDKAYVKQWHKFFISVSQTNVQFYCDDVLFDTKDFDEDTLLRLINEGDFKFGKSSWSGDSLYDGHLKNVRVYDHACTPADVAGLSKETLIANNAANWLNSNTDVVNWVKNNAATSSVKTANGQAYYYSNEQTGGYYSNVLYGSQNANWTSDYVTIGSSDPKLKFKYATPSTVVMMYDGVHAAYYGVKAEMRTSKNNSDKKRTLNYISSNNSNFSFRENWKCVKSQNDWDRWMSQGFNGETGFTNENRTDLYDIYNLTDSSWFLYNKLYVKNDINFNGGYYVNETPSAHALWNGDTQGDFGNTASIYAINYKPIAEKYEAVQNMVKKVIGDEDAYCTSGLGKFYRAAYKVLSLDPNSYFTGINDTQVDSAVQNCANAIATAVATLSDATTEPVTHTGGTATCTAKAVCEKCGVSYGEYAAHTPETVTGTPATCTTDGLTDGSKCAVCKTVLTAQEIQKATGHDYEPVTENYVTTYTCKNDPTHTYVIDKSALAAAIKTAEDEYLNNPLLTAKYQEPYITQLRDAVDSGKFKLADKDTTQIKVNISTEQIETSITNLVRDPKTYSVTVNVIFGDDSDDNQSTENYTVGYGEVFGTEIPLEEDQRVYKWVMSTGSFDTKLNTNDNYISQVITEDVTLNCYIDDYAAKEAGTSRVVYYDKNNKVLKIEYVPIGTYVSFDVEAPKVAFYTFTGWEPIFGEYSCASAAGVELRAKYEYSQTQANQVEIVGVGAVKVNGHSSYKAYYDEVINLTGATSYAYGEADGTVTEGILGDYIYAPNNQKTIYIVEGQSTKASTKLTGWIDDNNAVTVNAQYYLPSDCTFVEAGVKVAKTADDVQSGSIFKSNLQGETGEYSITLGYGSSKGTLYFASYLIYKDSDGKLQTIYSDAEAIRFGK